MNLITSFLLVFLMGSGTVWSQSLEDALQIFDRANRLVESGSYEEAIAHYHSVLETGYVSGSLYHNLAGAYFRLDEIGESVRYYERARKLLGDDPQLLHNIQIVEARVQSPFSELPTPFWRTWWEQSFGRYPAWPFLSTGIGLYLFAFFMLGHHLWSKTRNTWHRRIRGGLLAVGLTLILIAIMISGDRNALRNASVLESTTLMTESGSLDIPEGVRVTLVGESVSGVEVRLPNGTQGYMDADVLGDF